MDKKKFSLIAIGLVLAVLAIGFLGSNATGSQPEPTPTVQVGEPIREREIVQTPAGVVISEPAATPQPAPAAAAPPVSAVIAVVISRDTEDRSYVYCDTSGCAESTALPPMYDSGIDESIQPVEVP